MSTITLSTQKNFWVSTSIFKVTAGSKVKKVKTGSRIIFHDFYIDSYRFWVAESEYDLRFALRLILTSQWRHKHVSLFLCLKWICSHTESIVIFYDFHIDSYRFWVAESEYDLSFAVQLILTSQWRHKHVSLFLCLKWICSHTKSIVIFHDFHIDSYRFWVAQSEYDLSFAVKSILTSQWRHKHVSLFLCLKWLFSNKLASYFQFDVTYS